MLGRSGIWIYFENSDNRNVLKSGRQFQMLIKANHFDFLSKMKKKIDGISTQKFQKNPMRFLWFTLNIFKGTPLVLMVYWGWFAFFLTVFTCKRTCFARRLFMNEYLKKEECMKLNWNANEGNQMSETMVDSRPIDISLIIVYCLFICIRKCISYH